MRRAAIIVLDGLGIGPAWDTEAYGDTGSDTLGNVLRAWRAAQGAAEIRLPNLQRLGLGNCADLAGLRATGSPTAAWGTAQPRSAGKDSITGHWEICGLLLDQPFPT